MTAEPNNQYSRLKFNPFVDANVDLESYYPQLKYVSDGIRHLQEMRKEERQGLQVYVILMYDPESPLRTQYQDYGVRQQAAADQAGLDSLGLQVPECSDEWFVEMVIRFLKLVNSRLWTLIVINEEAFNEYAEKVMSPIRLATGMDDKDILSAATIKTKLMEACDDIHARLQKYYRELTGEDDELTAAIESKPKRLTPEQISRMGKGVS